MFSLGLLGCRTPSSAPVTLLTNADREAIRAIDTAFVQAWIRDDTSRVLGLFSSEAILFPPSSAPVEGLGPIRAYWWPDDGSHTRITSFTREIAEIEGTRQLAYLRGTAHLAWVYEKDGKSTAQSSRSTDLVLLALDGSGQWHIIRQMWNQLPP
jgi:ketosteroid isomerase-like protein